ncbi:TetR/AcrR family transcriptional regulator [Methylocapsa palsarum]|uniref:TetR/AcrR family transcriptional regulator n=1 Tax=Methylocapsa palsarum TaxID=1612308 RepID=UPI001587215F|nr:TetR/AcrR family transcriptional regulator [Methylocapsa palsarum]
MPRVLPQDRAAGPGRPKDLAKRDAILAAARALFFSRGVEGVGIEEIARRANVSKMTVYGHFRDKAAILSAIVAAEAARMTSVLDEMPGEPRNLEQRLVAVGTALMTFLTSPELLAFERLLMSEAARRPDLASAMLEAGPRFGHRKLAEQLAAATTRGDLAIRHPVVAAEQLTSLWKGFLYLECQLGVRPSPTAEEIHRHVTEGVAMFLRSYRPSALP